MITFDITGGCVLVACGVLWLGAWLVNWFHEDAVVFGPELTRPAPGICGCGAPKAVRLEPFPGDPVITEGPVKLPDYAMAAIGHGGDTSACVESDFTRIQARQVNERLAAEEAEEALS